MARLGNIVNSIKHYVQISNQAVTTGTRLGVALVDSIVAPAAAATSSVLQGSIIKAVYIEMWLKSGASAGTSVQQNFIIEKCPSGLSPATYTELLNMGAYPNKKNVLFTTQGNMGDLTTQAVPVHRQWIKIPKGKQRFGLGDRLFLTMGATGATVQMCGLAIYKEYR